MLKRNVIFVVILLFSALGLQAQTNFLPGYYVTSDLDTVRGFIEYRSESHNQFKCLFKERLKAGVVTLYPNQIRGFVVKDSDIYETHIFKPRRHPDEELYGFFRVIIRGKVDLLKFKKEYYAIDSIRRMYDLSKKSEVVGRRMLTDNYGMGVLKFLVKDCPPLARAVEKKYTSSKESVSVIEEYHRCIGRSFVKTQHVKIAPSFRFGISGSLTATHYYFTDPILLKVQFDRKVIPEIGLYGSLFIPRVSEKVRLMAEILYGMNSTYAFFNVNNTNNDYFLQYSYLRVPLFIRYSPSAFFVEFGLEDQIIVSQEARWRQETLLDGNVFTEDQSPKKMKSQGLGFVAAAGVKLKVAKLSIQPAVRYSQVGFDKSSQFQSFEFNVKIGMQ